MRRYRYIGQLLGLLAGFYLLCAAVIVGLVVVTVLAFRAFGTNRATLALVLVTGAAVFVVLRGVFVSTHVKAREIAGVEVRERDEPALWARVGQLAAAAGTRAPRRIHLVPDVNAAVWENPRLLGLIPGKRQMMIGLPLLMALTPAQFDAVVAHELGHYGGGDTQISGLAGRVRGGVLAVLRAAGSRSSRYKLPGGDLFVVLFQAYARLVLRFTQDASRAQEYAADRVAARIAGRANTIAALRELHVASIAFRFYLNRYLGRGLDIGLVPMPAEALGGFTALLADPARKDELDEIRAEPQSSDSDPYDSHPPIPHRIAALEALPDDGIPLQGSEVRAIAVLANPAAALATVAGNALRKQIVGKQAVPWDVLAQATGLHRAQEQAQPLQQVVAQKTGRAPSLHSLVELIAAGRFDEVLDALPRNEAAKRTRATGRVAREHAKTELARMLTGWFVSDLARTGRARWTHSWADIDGKLHIAPELEKSIAEAVDALVAVRPDDAPLRAFVDGIGVPA